MMESTKKFPDEFPGRSMKRLPELYGLVEKVSVDSMNWVTLYRCKTSGELWEERYESSGHGDVPTVRRVKSS